MTLSNSELNNICPHGKGSTKSESRTINKAHVEGFIYDIVANGCGKGRRKVSTDDDTLFNVSIFTVNSFRCLLKHEISINK